MNKKIGMKEAISIGIGGMVGGGIFAVLGLAVSLAKGGTPIAFLFAGGMVIFVAYEGFELIANAAPDITNPEKNIPRAYYFSVFFVILLYIIIALVTVGSLPFSKIATAQDYVLAEAAKPMLGTIGFSVITVAALISTFSAINASLLGGSRVNYEIAEDDELPHHFLAQLWNQPIGLMITALATLFLVNILDLESISTAGSVGFLLIFGIVNFVGYRLSKQTKSKSIIPMVGFVLCIIATLILITQQYHSNIIGVIVSISIIGFCIVAEWVYKKTERKKVVK